MPEMPEVETVRRTLIPLVKGKTIAKIIIWYPKIIVNDPDEFVKKLTNKKILKIDRYGKYLLFRFNDGLTMVSHLRMEGKYHLVTPDQPKGKHEHVEFVFTDGTALRYADVRKFGRMHLVETGTEKQTTGIRHLGGSQLSADDSQILNLPAGQPGTNRNSPPGPYGKTFLVHPLPFPDIPVISRPGCYALAFP